MPSRRLHTRVSLISYGAGAIGLVLFSLFYWQFGTRLNQNDGLGFDGLLFGRFAQNLELKELNETGRGQRLLPSVLVHYGLRAFSQDHRVSNIVFGFYCLNVVCLLLAIWGWARISQFLKLSGSQQGLGAVALFLNYATVTHAFLNPVATDCLAYALALWAANFYVRGARLALCGVALLGAFTWPVALMVCTLLLVFPWRQSSKPEWPLSPPRWTGKAIAGLFCFVTLAAVAYSYSRRSTLQIRSWSPAWMEFLLPVSGLVVGLYLYFGLAGLLSFRLDNFKRQAPIFLRSAASGLALAAGVWLVVAWITKTVGLVTPQEVSETKQTLHFLPLGGFLPLLPLRSTERLGVFLTSHVVYFGPVVLLLCFGWKRLAELAHTRGVGFTLLLGAHVVLALNSESRHLLFSWPLLVIALVQWNPLNSLGVKQFFWISLIATQVWVRFPSERLALNVAHHDRIGPFMGTGGYWMSCLVTLLSLVAVVWIQRQQKASLKSETNRKVEKSVPRPVVSFRK